MGQPLFLLYAERIGAYPWNDFHAPNSCVDRPHIDDSANESLSQWN